MGHARLVQGLRVCGHAAAGSHEHRPRRIRCLFELARKPLGDVLGLVGFGEEVPDVHLALTRLRRGLELLAALDGGQRRRDRVGHAQDLAVVAPRGRQRELVVLAAVREVGCEALHVRRARAAPGVDGLFRVAHGHDRLLAEELGEQSSLADRGVLILVENHLTRGAPHLLGDRRVEGDDLRGVGHLVGEFNRAEFDLARLVDLGEAGIHRELVESFELEVRTAQGLREGLCGACLDLVGGRGNLGGVVGDFSRVAAVLAHCPRDLEGACCDGANGSRAEAFEARVVGGEHDRAHERECARLVEQQGIGFAADEQGVLLVDVTRVRVVGRHLRQVELVDVDVPGEPQPFEPGLDPLAEFAGGLAGEGEAEHL